MRFERGVDGVYESVRPPVERVALGRFVPRLVKDGSQRRGWRRLAYGGALSKLKYSFKQKLTPVEHQGDDDQRERGGGVGGTRHGHYWEGWGKVGSKRGGEGTENNEWGFVRACLLMGACVNNGKNQQQLVEEEEEVSE